MREREAGEGEMVWLEGSSGAGFGADLIIG